MSLDFEGRMSYGDYLKLDTLLSAQSPLSDKQDETLFVIVHHVQELWLKLIINELEFAMGNLREDKAGIAFKALARISAVQEQLITAWDVLSTMTPSDYMTFRDQLGQASGFQSYQYRLVEILLGAKDERMLAPHRHRPEIFERLEAAFRGPSIYDEAIALVGRAGFDVPDLLLKRDFSKTHTFSDALRDIWLQVYREPERYFELYELAEELVDVEDRFQQWRFRHMKTVERIIGYKKGTGGSSGVGFLKTALDRTFFPELWAVRTDL
ncbi:tryptophan 2,3-dioxygenase [Hoeflea sp. TYP-13]|uniref:tryptophan 2,3-dioxygenase n=1 Tax=Hoeflea sp. TYP-13 TaxID=3230023 RepID=UPI0034C5DDE1